MCDLVQENLQQPAAGILVATNFENIFVCSVEKSGSRSSYDYQIKKGTEK